MLNFGIRSFIFSGGRTTPGLSRNWYNHFGCTRSPSRTSGGGNTDRASSGLPPNNVLLVCARYGISKSANAPP